jgi:O-antigen ligase
MLTRLLEVAGATLLAAGVIVGIARINPPGASTVYTIVAIALTVTAAAYLVWFVQPAYIFCGAIFLSPISANWEHLGIPGFAAPDRLLLCAGIAAILVRAPSVVSRPSLRIEPIHWLMLVTAAYAVVSAIVVDTLVHRGPFFRLLETFGLLPFLTFLAAPLAFRTARERDVLLRTLVFLGLWLGATTLFDKIHLDALVFPSYILDPSVGIHFGRGRGPFVEAVTNGFAQYVCAVACAVAWTRWRVTNPGFAYFSAGVAALCLTGSFLSLERSVWLGVSVATVVALSAIGEARRHAPAVLSMLAIVVGGSLVLLPGFADEVQERGDNKQTVWDRKNLARASFNMVEARPLVGFGWDQFTKKSTDYFELAEDYPLTLNITRAEVHNVPLTYAAELGLVGLLLWAGVLVTGVGGALATRGPPDLMAWRAGLLAVAVCYFVVTNFVPPSVFPPLVLWLWAGVVWAGRYGEAVPVHGPDGSASAPQPGAQPA